MRVSVGNGREVTEVKSGGKLWLSGYPSHGHPLAKSQHSRKRGEERGTGMGVLGGEWPACGGSHATVRPTEYILKTEALIWRDCEEKARPSRQLC